MICDTSGLLAAFDPDDGNHAQASEILGAARPPLVVCPLVIAELDYLLRRQLGRAEARTVLEELGAGSFELPDFELADLHRTLEVDGRYRISTSGSPTRRSSCSPPATTLATSSPWITGTSASWSRCRVAGSGCCPAMADLPRPATV